MIRKIVLVLSIIVPFNTMSLSNANHFGTQEESLFDNICKRQTLTEGFFGMSDNLAGSGIEVGFAVTNVYQQNVRGGISTHRRAGRNSGSYDLEVLADLDKLLGLENGGLYIHAEGGWTDTEGIDGVAVGSAFGINSDAKGNRSLDIIECFYEGSMFENSLNLMMGKIDFTWVFDGSEFADCECTQFMNDAFVNNPTIPFPAYSLAVVLSYEPDESWYVMGGAADAQADGRETGFRTTFYGEDYFLYMLEAGVKPELESSDGTLHGTYRIGLWNDPQPKANSDSVKNYRDDVGFYLSCDQMLAKENNQAQDSQGLGAFVRYGYADSKKNDITNFWSVGFQYQGLMDSRDDDILGAGYARGTFSNCASATYPEDYESAMELYYNTQLTPWLNISPSVQYITNPGGSNMISDAVVVGLRAQMLF